MKIWQEIEWDRGGVTHSEGTQVGSRTRARCSKEKASIHKRGPKATSFYTQFHKCKWKTRKKSKLVGVFLCVTDFFISALQATGRWRMRRASGTSRCARVPTVWWRGWTTSSTTSPPKEATSFSLLSRNYNSRDSSLNSCWTRAIADTRYKRDFAGKPSSFSAQSLGSYFQTLGLEPLVEKWNWICFWFHLNNVLLKGSNFVK